MSLKFVHNFLSYLGNRKRQKSITPLVEAITYLLTYLNLCFISSPVFYRLSSLIDQLTFLLASIYSLECVGTVGWATGRASGLKKAGCWYVSGDELSGALHVL